MADYWKSNDRKYCDFCKCWIADNKSSVQFHENGKRHQVNVQKRITEISRNSYKAQQEQNKVDASLKKMNDAAMKAYMQDISSRADISSRELYEKQKLEEAEAAASQEISNEGPSTSGIGPGCSDRSKTPRKKGRKADPLYIAGAESDSETESKKGKTAAKKPRIEDAAKEGSGSMWVEAESDVGYPYFWNVKTGESIWEAPKEGFMKKKEYENLSKVAWQKQRETAESASKYELENADEIAARLRRESMAQIFKRNKQVKDEIEKMIDHKRDTKNEYESQRSKNPYGTWETVELKDEKPIDLELPTAPTMLYIPSIPQENPEPKFKEKKIVNHIPADVKATVSDAFIKKRKVQRNARQRLDND